MKENTIHLFNEDCLNILKTLEPESIDCVITDCPYHIISGGCTQDPVKIGRYTETSVVLSKRNKSAQAEYTKQGKLFKHNDIEFSEWLPEVYRILKPDTHCYIMINPRNLKELQEVAENSGFSFQQLIVWDKGNTTPNKYYLNTYELILMLRKGRARNINNMGTKNILKVPNITRIKKHPTEKPVELMQILVENSTDPGNIVLDPFMGVGGVGIACKNTGREFIGIEIDSNYYQIAKERLSGMPEDTRQMTIFDFLQENE